MVSALILIADGTEEMEFVITYDTLVRAGIHCTSAFVGPLGDAAVLSRGVRIIPDKQLKDVENANGFDAIIVPGGAKGAETISTNEDVQELIRSYHSAGKIVGMICAGSLAALTSGLPRTKITSHPSVRPQLEAAYEYSEDSVVTAGNLVTSRGPGTAFPFALRLVSLLVDDKKRKEVEGPMIFPPGALIAA
ncbi:hypothetical protein BOTBODRAFT_36238 [Botryobasidium botryosum FD-172 SS1]|uniref:D-lactate dehydratase n=1 Tax=Botryobasidium botryosum (strain FD-172 SS1) TaxID=930990 RepID=A0A067M3M3_BOTB1|nr:hypothetical protein BOTBODRAFT_36238 [Botryobasidium botryosum FD-172 SS1]